MRVDIIHRLFTHHTRNLVEILVAAQNEEKGRNSY